MNIPGTEKLVTCEKCCAEHWLYPQEILLKCDVCGHEVRGPDVDNDEWRKEDE